MKRFSFTFLLVLWIFGCAGSIANYNDFNTLSYKGIPDIDKNKSLVCIYRPSHSQSFGSLPLVFKEGSIIGVLKNGTYFCEESEPGEYSYYIELGGFGKEKVSVLLKLDSGKKYFVAYRALLDRLEEVSQSLATKEINGLKYIKLKN